MRTRPAMRFGLLLAALCFASPGWGEPVRLYATKAESAADCPDAVALAESLSRVSPHRVEASPDKHAEVDVAFARRGGVYSAVLRVRKVASGERVISDPSDTCAALSDSVTLAMALVLDETQKSPDRTTQQQPPPPEKPTPKKVVRAEGLLGVAAGFVRPSALAVSGGFWWEPHRRLSTGLGFFYVPTQSLPLAPGFVDVSATMLSLRGCISIVGNVETARLSGCVAMAGGVLRAAGRGFDRVQSRVRPSFAPGLALEGMVPLAGPLALVGRGEVLVPVQRETFGVEGIGVAYDPPVVAGTANVGLSLRIW